MSGVLVRRADPGDLTVLAPLLDDYRVFYGQPSDPGTARDFLQARLERSESVVFLATLEGRPAGFTQLYPLFTTVGLAPIWLLNDLYVAPQARRSGVARALLDAAREHGRDTGARRLMLNTERGNLAAQAAYEGHGWQRDERFLTYELPL